MFCWSCVVRIGRLWQPLPHRVGLKEGYVGRSLRYAIGLWYLVELTLALLGILCLGRICFRSNMFWVILLAICFTMVHALYWTDMRMRAPLMPVVALAAATGVVWVTTWPRRIPSAPHQPEASAMVSKQREAPARET
jgi:hypothetical protein